MHDEGVLGALARAARSAGRQVEAARAAYVRGRAEGSLPTDDAGRVRIVCRRHAEERAVHLEDGTPECHESDHPACESCAADVLEGVIETW
ncbi:MAG: hypothetical protein ABEJ76_04095 [Halanaeroarchaeum sp.]